MYDYINDELKKRYANLSFTLTIILQFFCYRYIKYNELILIFSTLMFFTCFLIILFTFINSCCYYNIIFIFSFCIFIKLNISKKLLTSVYTSKYNKHIKSEVIIYGSYQPRKTKKTTYD